MAPMRSVDAHRRSRVALTFLLVEQSGENFPALPRIDRLGPWGENAVRGRRAALLHLDSQIAESALSHIASRKKAPTRGLRVGVLLE
jgi:hypothetical protein